MYTKVEEALYFMIKANRGLKSKSDNVDRSFHPIGVYMIIREITDTEMFLSLLFYMILLTILIMDMKILKKDSVH